jgi:nucleotide-binding universal stress UspA family protein
MQRSRPATSVPAAPGASALEEETTVSEWKTILVGVDGSPGSRKALSWAAAEAADHGADLVVMNVWEHTLLPPAGSLSVSEKYVPDLSQRTADELVQLIKEELGEEPSVLVQPRVKQGTPAKVLIEESSDADLLVVGTRGHGGFAGLVLGSVSQHVAAYAQCPVTVVR